MKRFFVYAVAIVFCATELSYGSAEPKVAKKLVESKLNKKLHEEAMAAVAGFQNSQLQLADEILAVGLNKKNCGVSHQEVLAASDDLEKRYQKLADAVLVAGQTKN